MGILPKEFLGRHMVGSGRIWSYAERAVLRERWCGARTSLLDLCPPRSFSTTLTPDLPSCNSGHRSIHYHLGCATGPSFSTTTQQNPLRASFPRLRHQRALQGLHTLPSSPEPRLCVCRARDAVHSTHARDKAPIARRCIRTYRGSGLPAKTKKPGREAPARERLFYTTQPGRTRGRVRPGCFRLAATYVSRFFFGFL